jgi:hypothetical protein
MEELAMQLCTCADDVCGRAVAGEVAKVDLISNGSAYSKAASLNAGRASR